MNQSATTVSELLAEQAEELGEEPFLYFEDRVLSYADLNREVNKAANGLAALGVKEGVGVSIMMPNSPEWLFVYFATQKLCAYAVPVNVGLKGDGLRHVIDHSDSSVLLCDPSYSETIQAIRGELPKVKEIVVDTTYAPDGFEVPDQWKTLAEVMDAPDVDPEVEINQDAMSSLLYTSGTTGLPKGVVNRYSNTNLMGIRMLGSMLQPDDILYTCLPLFHANALFLTTLRALVIGRPMALSRRFSASRFWDEIRKYGATTFNALGAMIPILMKQPERSDDKDNPVRVVFSAACPASVWAEFEERFAVRIVEGYAAVDGGGYSVINMGNAPKGSIGKPMNPFKVATDDGDDAAPGEPGELLFKVDDAKLRKVEYYKNEEASNDKIKDGWFYTGDLVKTDEDGNLYFVDRKTDSLRRRGENISSWEVEREINKHPDVLESAVFGVPSELGEADVMAVVVPQEGATIDPEELASFCEEHMAAFMVPRYISVRHEIPKTETHRVQKGVLKREGVTSDTWDREAVKT
ncbi:MAG: AMP-dependent synthetase [Acidobacteria bacterium]|nr:MAG: AMP-dependent synthetase [Acidobacteriota bacterium]